MNPSNSGGPGFYGKVPSHADFLTRRLPSEFVEPWDEWLQSALTHSQRQLAEQWLEIYLGSPIWRFTLSTGICGNQVWTGILMPSVDRVGRYFPLTLATCLPPETHPLAVLARASDWLATMETVALSSLEDQFDLHGFDSEVKSLGTPDLGKGAEATPARSDPTGYNAWRLPVAAAESPLELAPELLHFLLDEFLFAYSLWWTHGSELIEPSLLLCQGLPPTEGFSGLLGGEWCKWGWQEQRTGPPYNVEDS